jgi:hypothetical protein
MSRTASVQTARLNLEAIEDDVLCLAAGQYRAVLEVGSVDFALKGEVEQEALVAGYAAFLNGLTFPVQLLVRVLPLDIDSYLGELEHRARHELPDQLAALARDHIAFVRRLARSRTLLERRFYLVVPAQGEGQQVRRSRLFRRSRDTALDLAAARQQLTFRCQQVARQLDHCGLKVRRLTSSELVQLYYACWCPELARVQRLQRALAEYTALVVQASPTGSRVQSPDRPSGNRPRLGT